MAVSVAISPGIFILLLCLQNILAQQCSNNLGPKNSAGPSPQSLQKAPCGLNQAALSSGINFNFPPQAMQQMNFQQQSNIQQAPCIQKSSSIQPQLNSQQPNSQQSASSITNSQLLQQPNQNLASNIFSALNNIRQSSPNQGTNNVKYNPPQQNNYEPLPQCHVNAPFTVLTPTMPQTVLQPPFPNSFVEHSQFQPTFAFQTAPSNNAPSQQNQQTFAVPAQNTFTNGQNNGYTSASASSQSASMQIPMVMSPVAQTNIGQSQPMVFTLQSPPAQSQPSLPMRQTIESQPIIYTVQTQPSPYPNQHQQLLNPPQGPNHAPTDYQSLISYVMSQMQNSPGNNALGSILPAMLSTKSEKSSSMKALLPLIFNMLNERRNSCGCPHCGCNNNNNNNVVQEPVINSGYSNQKNYSQKEPIQEVLTKTTENADSAVKSTSKVDVIKDANINNETTDISAETSEEDEEEDDSDEEHVF